jgi:hypothetical protein
MVHGIGPRRAMNEGCEFAGGAHGDDWRVAREATYGDFERVHPLPSVAYLRAVGVTCDAETGAVFVGGKEVDCRPNQRGLLQFGFASCCGHMILLERGRVVWALCDGRWAFMNDHLNGAQDDDRLANLIDCSPSVAQRNARACRLGPPVLYLEQVGLWQVRVWARRKKRGPRGPWIECYATKKEAEARLPEMLRIAAHID